MLQQFMPLFEHQKSTQNQFIPTKVTVKFPLLYRVRKDGRVHYLLGHVHPLPMDVMPEYLLQIISHCKCLLTESLATLPQELQKQMINDAPFYGLFTRFFSNRLKEDVKARFKADLVKILSTLSCLNSQHIEIEYIASTLLSALFNMFIKLRANPNELRIDEALILHFKNQNKPVVELNEQSKNEFVRYCLENEQRLQDQLQLNSEATEKMRGTVFLHSFAGAINDHYQNIGKEDLFQNEIIKKFLQTDLAAKEITHDDETKMRVQAENSLWRDIFMREHNKGTDHMLLPCGYAHILQPENSLLEMLAQEGFIVERVNESNLHMMNNESSYLKKINC